MKGMDYAMKRVGIIILVAISLAACSITPEQILFLPTRPPTLPPTEFMTPTITPSYTPVPPTPTFTLTPTLIGFKTATNTETSTPIPPTNTAGTPFTRTPIMALDGFASVKVSTAQFYVSGCSPATVTFNVQMSNWEVTFVELSTRFKSKTSGITGPWTSRGMQSLGNGMYSYELFPQEIKGFGNYENAWVQYQFVSTNGDGKQLGRTPVFAEALTLVTTPVECTATPDAPTPTP